MAKEEIGITSRDKGVFIPKSQRKPTNKANLFKSKAQYLADEKIRKENDAKAKAFREELENPKAEVPTGLGPDAKKKAGRPKKIE